MRTRVTTLFLACVAFVSVVAVAPAQAACRPTTLADLFPAVPETTATTVPPAPLVPGFSVPTTTAPIDPAGPSSTSQGSFWQQWGPTTTAAIEPSPTTTAASPPGPLPTPVAPCAYVYRMQWPVLGGGAVLSVFATERDLGARRHAGVDISAPKMTPVVAVRDGAIRAIHNEPGNCCWVTIGHDDGWSSWYLHLNNDVDGSDDGDGVGIRPDLVVGARVVAGEVIGWVGDSGNAEPTTPHLHFELHSRNGVAIDPLASLRWAFRRMPAPALEFGPQNFSGPYIDDDGLPAEPMFGLLTSLGTLRSCDAWNAAVCPHAEASTVDAVGWISALARVVIPVWTPTTSTEIVGQILEEARTCSVEGCPSPPITVGEAASILVWVEEQKAHDDALTVIEETLEAKSALIMGATVPPQPPDYWLMEPSVGLARLAERGLADPCSFPSPEPDQILTRAALAEMIGKAFGYLPVITCEALP